MHAYVVSGIKPRALSSCLYHNTAPKVYLRSSEGSNAISELEAEHIGLAELQAASQASFIGGPMTQREAKAD